jgi:chromosome segregation ATPase
MRSLMDEMGPKIAELNQMNAELRVLLDQRAKWRYKSLRRKTEPLRREVEGAQGEVDSLLRDKDQIEALGKLQMEEADVLRAQLEPGSVATAPVTLTVPP